MVQVELIFKGANLKEVREALISGAGDLLQYGIVSQGGVVRGQGLAPDPSHAQTQASAASAAPPSDLVNVPTNLTAGFDHAGKQIDNDIIHTLEKIPKKRGRKPKSQSPITGLVSSPAASSLDAHLQESFPQDPQTSPQPPAADAPTIASPKNEVKEAVLPLVTFTDKDALSALQAMNDGFAKNSDVDTALAKSKGVLNEFGVNRARELKPDQYQAFIIRCKELTI